MKRAAKPAPPKPTEAQEQAALIDWFDHYAKRHAIDPRLLFAIPNGAVLAGDARRRAMQMTKLKRTGLRPGIPDLFLAGHKRDAAGRNVEWYGLFIEMKRKGEKVRHGSAQQAIGEKLITQGYMVAECAGADDAMKVIKDYLA